MITECAKTDWKETFAGVPNELEAGRFYTFKIDDSTYDWEAEGGWGICQNDIPGFKMHSNGILNGTIPFNPALPNYTITYSAFHNNNPGIGIMHLQFRSIVIPSPCSLQPQACTAASPNSYCGTDPVVARRFPDSSGCSCLEGFIFDSSDGVCIEEYSDTDALLLQPELSYPIDGRSLVPLKDFSMLLTFTETIQRGVSDDYISLKTTAGKLVERTACQDGPLSFFGRVMVIPVTMMLDAKTMHSVTVPSTCVRKAAKKPGQPYSLLAYDDATYNFETQPTGSCGGLPERISGIKPSNQPGMVLPLEPARGAWVTHADTKYSLYFSEAMQAARGFITVKERTGSQAETIRDVFRADDQQRVQFDSIYKGRAHIGHTSWFKPGAQYTLTLGVGALADRAQNHLLAQFEDANLNSEQGPYRIQMSTSFVSNYPRHRCCKHDPKLIFTKNHRLVFDFADAVFAGEQPLTLCPGWSADNPCVGGPRTLATHDMIFLGKKVILNPVKAGLSEGSQYNVSIPDDTFHYFSGISASGTAKEWSYEFSLSNLTVTDNEVPELVTGLVDCNGDDSLLSPGTPYASICDADEDGSSVGDFNELMGVLDSSGQTGLPTTARFKLYFNEKIAKTATTQATLVADDAPDSPMHFREQDGKVVVGTGKYDSLVTLKPVFSTGKLYTLSLGSGEITDDSVQKNPYGGTSFLFYTPLKLATYGGLYPENGAGNVPPSGAIRIRFADIPRLGPTPGGPEVSQPIVKVGDDIYFLTDMNAVKFQDKDLLLLPKPLQAKKTYLVTIPKHHLRYMTTDLSFSFTTRFMDMTPPMVIAASPTSSSDIPKIILDPSAPYVHVSESVSGSANGMVQIQEDGVPKYTISASDSDCATSSLAPTNPCVEMDSFSRKVSFYPLGKIATGTAVPWATSGTTYRIDIPTGTFTDSLTTGAMYNNLSASSFSFTVHPDSVGPTLSRLEISGENVESASMSLSADSSSDPKLNPAASIVLLFFNENIQVGDNSFALKSWKHSTEAPRLLDVSPTMTKTLSNDRTQTITLSFNCKVQAGAGSFQIFVGDSDIERLPNIPGSHAHWLGTKVVFKPSTLLVNGASYYLRSSHKDTIRTSGFGAASDLSPINTKESLRFMSQAGQASPTFSWTTLDDYVCLSANGLLPDIDMYMSEDVKLYSGRKVALCSSTSSCWGSPQPSNGVWSLTVPGQLALDVNAIARYWATVYTSQVATVVGKYPLQESTQGSLWLQQGLFYDYGAGLSSPSHHVSFFVCSSRFDAFGTPLVRLYSPQGLGTLSQGSARQFEVTIPASALKDIRGNTGIQSEMASFEHETLAPTVFPDACNPPFDWAGSRYENIVLAFNEVVQAGTGSFEIYSSEGRAYSISVLLQEGVQQPAIFSGNKVSITPKTTCDSTRRRTPPPETNSTESEAQTSLLAENLSNYTNETFEMPTTTMPSQAKMNESNSTNATISSIDSTSGISASNGTLTGLTNNLSADNGSNTSESHHTSRRLGEEDLVSPRKMQTTEIDPCSQEDLKIGVSYWG
jgi:hypothetical protein